MTKPIKWNEYELTEFFGVLPEKDEDEFYLSFSVEKDGLRLDVTFFNYDFDLHLNVFRDGIDEPVLRTKIMSSAGAKYISHENGYECLEIGAADKYIDYYGKEWIASMAVRLRVKPHISVELFRPEAV
jgi:hypothetical protein